MLQQPHNLGAQFEARYDSNCKGCDSAIYAGDLMGYVDDVAQCKDCYAEAVRVNHVDLRANIEAQREEERAKDPEAFARREAAVKKWTDSVKARSAQEPGKEWVTSPGATPGWVRAICPKCNLTLPCECEPSTEPEEAVMAVEPGIQALMAAGLLQGQEPGGDGVCHATVETAGIVTEVDIPVPVDPPAAKAARAPRKSRAKAKAEAPSVDSAEGPAAALERVRLASVSLVPAGEGTGSIASDAEANVQVEAEVKARMAELDAAAAVWLPGQVEADVLASRGIDVNGPAVHLPTAQAALDVAKVSALQAGLQSAVDSGVMTPAQAAAMGWTAPAVDPWATVPALAPHIAPPVDPVWAPAYGEAVAAGTVAAQTLTAPPAPASPRTAEPLEEFRRDPSTDRASLFLDALAGARTAPEEDAILAALDDLPPYAGPGTVKDQKSGILEVIVGAINAHPRSLQRTIGPSEIGTECDHCLAAKLAQWEQTERGEAWLPTVGTAVHSWIQDAFDRHPDGAAGTRRWLTERRVAVGEIDGVEVTGSTDLVDVVAGWTWDWKIVGPTTLKAAKVKPSTQYVVQQMLYARGWNRLGVKVTNVGIAYLPRNAMTLSAAVWWSAPYDEQIAVDALERANKLALNIRAMRSVGGDAMVDSYVSGLPRWRQYTATVDGMERAMVGNSQEGRIVCLDCARYPDYPADPAEALKQLDGLL